MKIVSNVCLSLVAIFFIPLSLAYSQTSKNYTSYRRYPYCSPSDYMRYPKTIEEVVSIVKEAIRRGVTVKAFGSRHSQTDIICTKGIPVDMTGFKSFRMNEGMETATFGAGVTVWEAGEFLEQNGRALRTTPAFGGITLGGAIGTGAHGSTIKYNSSISSQVVSMTVVDGRGKVLVISDPENLKAFKINLGLLGIVVDITLYTVPLYKVLAHNYVIPDDVLTNGVAMHWAKTTDQITLHWYPAFKEVVVSNLTFVSAKKSGSAWTNAIVPSSYDIFNLVTSIAKELAFDLTSSECAAASTLGYTILRVIEFYTQLSLWTLAPLHVPIHTEDGLLVKNPAVGDPHKMLSAICSGPKNALGEACVWDHGPNNLTILDNEFNLALSDLPVFIETVKDIVEKTPTAFPLQGMYMRFSGKSHDWMSTSFRRDGVHVEFYLLKRDDPYEKASGSLAGYQTILQTLAIGFKARSHWGKCGLVYHNREFLQMKLDPTARQNFVTSMKKFDPNRVFLNNFGRRILEEGYEIDIDPLTTRCAMLDNCICSDDSHCADTQICATLPGYNYHVCKTRNVVPEKTFDKKILPQPNGIVGWLISTVPTLVTTVLANCTIDGVLKTVTGTVSTLVSTVPKVVSTVPKVVSTVPKVVSTVPKVVSTVPKVVSTVPKVVNTVPEIVNTVPKVLDTLLG